MKRVMLTVLLADLMFSLVARAQTRPDFSGTWSMDPGRSQSAVQNEPIRSQTLIIKQTDIELSIETKRDGAFETVSYRPGASDTLAVGFGRSGLLSSVWYWEGAKLVTETLRNVSDSTVRTRQIHTMDRGGSEMTVETLLVVEHGYTMRGAQNYSTGKDVFKKIAP